MALWFFGMHDELTIPRDYILEFCKPGKMHLTCRYMGGTPSGIQCMKHSDIAHLLDERVEQKQMVARGDNCEGWIFKIDDQV